MQREHPWQGELGEDGRCVTWAPLLPHSLSVCQKWSKKSSHTLRTNFLEDRRNSRTQNFLWSVLY